MGKTILASRQFVSQNLVVRTGLIVSLGRYRWLIFLRRRGRRTGRRRICRGTAIPFRLVIVTAATNNWIPCFTIYADSNGG